MFNNRTKTSSITNNGHGQGQGQRGPVLQKINVIIPMAGLGSRFTNYGFKENKYLLPMDNKTPPTKMIKSAIMSLGIHSRHFDVTFIFIIRKDEIPEKTNEIKEYLMQICFENQYKCEIIEINELTEGPASTAILAMDYINNDTPLIISNSDQILDWNFMHFYNTSMNYDGCVLTYTPNYELVMGSKDKHSFVRLNTKNEPVQFAEKVIIGTDALVGVHFYKRGGVFVDAYKYMYNKRT